MPEYEVKASGAVLVILTLLVQGLHCQRLKKGHYSFEPMASYCHIFQLTFAFIFMPAAVSFQAY